MLALTAARPPWRLLSSSTFANRRRRVRCLHCRSLIESITADNTGPRQQGTRRGSAFGMVPSNCSTCGRNGATDSNVCPACGRILTSEQLVDGANQNQSTARIRVGLGLFVGLLLGYLTTGLAFFFTAGGHGWLSPCIVSAVCLVNYPLAGIGWTTVDRTRKRGIGIYLVVCAVLSNAYFVALEEMNYPQHRQNLFSEPWPWQAIAWALLYFAQQGAGLALLMYSRAMRKRVIRKA
jgi:hypothetical protein